MDSGASTKSTVLSTPRVKRFARKQVGFSPLSITLMDLHNFNDKWATEGSKQTV